MVSQYLKKKRFEDIPQTNKQKIASKLSTHLYIQFDIKYLYKKKSQPEPAATECVAQQK